MAEITATDAQVNLWASHHVETRTQMDYITFEMLALADNLLVAHRHDGNASVSRVYTKADWYIVLEDHDPKNNLGAMSIEYGHDAYYITYDKPDGTVGRVIVGASEPTYILTNATGIRRKKNRISSGGKTFKRHYYIGQTGLGGLKGRLS